MSESNQLKRLYEFDAFRLDPEEKRLRRNGELVPLPPRAFDLLLVLVKNSGQLMDKEELLRQVWPDTVVEEANLSVNVSALRKALHENPDAPQFIETLPRRGYRFLLEVREVAEEESRRVIPVKAQSAVTTNGHPSSSSLNNSSAIPAPEPPVSQNSRAWFRLPLIITAALLLMALLLFAVFQRRTTIPLSVTNALTRVIPLTSFPGQEFSPAFSPDGNEVAFVWSGEKNDNLDIYVRLVEGSNPVRVTTNPAEELNPVWAPDGRRIAFYRRGVESDGVYLVPALGGAERKLTDTFANRYALASRNYLHWSPDGKWIAISDKNAAHEPFGIFFISPESGEKIQFTKPSASYIGDRAPAFSPDGKMLAFVRVISAVVEDIFLVPVAGGQPRRLTTDNTRVNAIAWMPDNNQLVFSSRRNGADALWSVKAEGGQPEWIAAGGSNVSDVALSRNRLAFTQNTSSVNLWRASAVEKEKPGTSLIASTMSQFSPQYSRDGQRIAFVSNRTGSHEIWVCSSEGESPVQLTAFRGPLAGTPHWSPDGKQIVFDSRPDGNADIFVISSEGGNPRRLTTEASEDIVPYWSRDGRWIYFSSNRSGSMQIWKMSVEGNDAVQITRQGGFEPVESADRQWLYYTKDRGIASIWRIPIAGGEESLVLDFQHPPYSRYWALTERGICFAAPESDHHTVIRFYNFSSGQISNILRTEKNLAPGSSGLAVSPDGRWLLYPQTDMQGSDLMLLENFR